MCDGKCNQCKSEALVLHELSSEKLGAVSGGGKQRELEDRKQADALKAFQQLLNELP